MVERKVLIYYFMQSIFICRRQYKKMYMRILWMCLSVKLSTWLSLNLRNAYEISVVLGYDDFDTVKSWRRRGKKVLLDGTKRYPARRIWTTDLRMTMNMPLQSSALPTELSRDHTKLRLFWVFILLDNYSAWQMVIDYNFITTIASSYRPSLGDFILCSSTYNIFAF